MKRVISVLLVMVMCLGLLVGCGSSDSGSDSSSEDSGSDSSSSGDKKRIVFVLKNSNSDFFVSMGEYAKARAEEYGWELEVLAPIEADNNEEEIQLIEQSLLDPPDAYCVVPADSEGITPAIEQINEAGIPVVNVNTMFYDDSLECVSFVAANNVALGETSGEVVVDLLGGEGKVILLEGTTGAQTSIDRMTGVHTILDSEDGIEIIDSQTANYMRQDALTVTQNLLQKHAEVDVIWAAAGEMALGAAEAVKQAGREDEIQIVTINAFKEMIEAVIDGRVARTVDDASWLQGQTAIDVLKAYFDGETVEEKTLIDGVVVSDENLDDYKEMWGLN
ncbi:MAG: sugar ABC transporter substrate-binding protein [Suipraeoptans sp.]